MNKKIVLSKHNLIEFIISFFSFNLLFGTLTPDSFQKAINMIGIAISLFIALIVLQYANYNRSKIKIEILLFLFGAGALYSTYCSRESYMQMNSWQAGIYFVFRILSFFVMLVYSVERGDGKEIIKEFFVISLIYCLINDLVFIPQMAVFRATQGYLLGNKFSVSYMHLEMVAFYIFQGALGNKTKKNITLVLILYSLTISLLVDCITGVMGVLFFIVLAFLLPKKITRNPLLWVVISVLSFASVYNYNYIVETDIYQKLFVRSLDRGVTLTGRMNIYKELPHLMSGHWLWGYGPSSSYEVIHNYLNMPNTQNGFWDIILQVGIVSFTFLALLTIYSIYQIDKKKENFLIPIIAMLDMYSVLAIFEITISLSFIGFVIIAAVYSSSQVIEI